MKIRSHRHIIYFVLMLAYMLSTSICRAQNNLYKIDDECYKIMLSMSFKDSESDYLKKTEEMYNLARKKGDTKAQTIAISQRLVFYDNNKMLAKMREQAEKLRQEAQKTGHKQYYYFAYAREIEDLLENEDVESSLQIAKKMLKDANNDSYVFGKFSCYQELGNIYKARHNNRLSTEYYKKALEIAPRLVPKQRTTEIYISLASLSKNLNDRMTYYEKAMNEAMETRDSLNTLEAMCITYGMYEKEKDFRKYNALAEDMLKRAGRGIDRQSIATAYKAGFDKNYEEAYSIIDNTLKTNSTDNNDALIAGEKISLWAKDGERAVHYAMERGRNNSIKFNNHRGLEFAELNDLIENENLQSQKAEQDRNRAILLLESQNMEQSRLALVEETSALSRLDLQMEHQNKLAEDNNKRKEEELKNAEKEKEYRIQAELEKEQDYMSYTLVVVISVLAIMTAIIVAFLLYYRYTGIRMLRYAKILHKARNEAQEASAMKNIFIQNMSHEIRTPLNAIMGFSQLMTIPGLPLSEEEKVEYAEHILNNAKMLTMLVDDILNTAEIEKGNYSIKMVECCANEILAAAISTAEYRAQDGVKIYYTSEATDDFVVVTDPRRTQQVLINFLTNACKHTDAGTIHLHLSLTENPDKLTFSVADTGCGIPKEQAENIFDRFTKLNDFKQGTGLGLNICRLISKKMGGKVYCDTSYTKGARFVFVLPLVLP